MHASISQDLELQFASLVMPITRLLAQSQRRMALTSASRRSSPTPQRKMGVSDDDCAVALFDVTFSEMIGIYTPFLLNLYSFRPSAHFSVPLDSALVCAMC